MTVVWHVLEIAAIIALILILAPSTIGQRRRGTRRL